MAGPTRLPHNIKNARVLAAGPAEMYVVQYQDHSRSTQILMGFRSDKKGTWFEMPKNFTTECRTLGDSFIKQLEKSLGKPSWDQLKSMEKKIVSLERKIVSLGRRLSELEGE